MENRDYCCFSIKIRNIHSSCATAGSICDLHVIAVQEDDSQGGRLQFRHLHLHAMACDTRARAAPPGNGHSWASCARKPVSWTIQGDSCLHHCSFVITQVSTTPGFGPDTKYIIIENFSSSPPTLVVWFLHSCISYIGTITSSHWGQRGYYPGSKFWIFWEFFINLLTQYPLGKFWVFSKIAHHFNQNLLTG